jgi:hypothetical protein
VEVIVVAMTEMGVAVLEEELGVVALAMAVEGCGGDVGGVDSGDGGRGGGGLLLLLLR